MKQPKRKPSMSIQALINVAQKLRSPHGCPWDRKQTLTSIIPYFLEETYELVDALEEKNKEKVKEELADLLYLITFACQLAEESERFSFNDVIKTATAKLVRRHPHVFGNKKIRSISELFLQWHDIKSKEKAHKNRTSLLDGIPKAMPALHKAVKVQKKVAQVGFEFSSIHDTMLKVEEELAEVKEALKKKNPAQIEEELGDIIFSIVNVARFLSINPERMLEKTVKKFIHRFQTVETIILKSNRSLKDVSLEEMDRLWNACKTKKKQRQR